MQTQFKDEINQFTVLMNEQILLFKNELSSQLKPEVLSDVTTAAQTVLKEQKVLNDKSEGKDKTKKEVGKKRTKKEQKALDKEAGKMSQTQNSS